MLTLKTFHRPQRASRYPTCQRVAGPHSRRTAVRMNAGKITDKSNKTGVLFVCLGNICRSPTAEAVFKDAVEKAGLSEQYLIDSCGTGGGSSEWYKMGGYSYHEGDKADSRMSEAAQKRGIKLTSRSRPLDPSDFKRFQYIIGMDDANMKSINVAANYWKRNGQDIPDGYQDSLYRMMSFSKGNVGLKAVPDPYFGGSQGFEDVLDLLDDACHDLLACTQADGTAKALAE